MPKTNYRDCWWLIRAITGEFDSGSYKGGRGYSLRNLNDLLPSGERVKYDWFSLSEPAKKERESFRHDIMRRRAIVYNEFGLAILSESDSGKERGKGEGGYYYYLANPELLDGETKTLRSLIEFLANSETERDSWVKVGDIDEDYRDRVSSAMGFVSAGTPTTYGYLSNSNTTPRKIFGEENLPLVQFAMKFGEVLTIKYGKIRAGIDINAPYSFEPYQVKEIEGRWYAIGNLYPMGHKESAELAVYDLARLEFAYDEENPDVLYEPIKNFNVYHYINRKLCVDNKHPVIQEPFISVDIKTYPAIRNYLKKHPLCSAQVRQGLNEFKLYIRFTHNLITQLGSFGNEISIKAVPMAMDEYGEYYLDVIQGSLNLFRIASDEKQKE